MSGKCPRIGLIAADRKRTAAEMGGEGKPLSIQASRHHTRGPLLAVSVSSGLSGAKSGMAKKAREVRGERAFTAKAEATFQNERIASPIREDMSIW